MGESWQCPIAQGTACASVSEADPAVATPAKAWETTSTAPLRPTETTGTPFLSGILAWFVELFSAEEDEEVATAEPLIVIAAAEDALSRPYESLRTKERVARIWNRALRGRERNISRGQLGTRSHKARGLEAAVIERLKDIFGGADALAPWTLPAVPAPLVDLLPWRAWDESGEFYVNAGSLGFVLELPPFAGVDEGTLDALAGTLADSAPDRSVVQVIHWTSPRYGAAIAEWAGPREAAGGLQAVMAKRRAALFTGAGWRALHAGGPPFTLNDCRVFLAASLPGRPGPAAETALGGFRRAIEGALASIGTWSRRMEPDALLSLAAELASPDTEGVHDGGLERPGRRWSPRDSDSLTVRGAWPRDERCAGGTGLPPPGRGGRCRARALRPRIPGSLARLAGQCPDRGFLSRFPATRRAGPDRAHRDDGRGGRRGTRVLEVRPRDAAGGDGDRALPARPSREGPRLALRDRAAQGRRTPGQGLLHGGGLRTIGRDRRGRAGGARHLPRPGLAAGGGALRAPPWLALLPAHGRSRRTRRRPRPDGPDEDAAHLIRRQPGACARRVAGPEGAAGRAARASSPGKARAARPLVSFRERKRGTTTWP